MEPACRKDKPKLNSTPTRGDRTKQKSAQQELKQRQRAEVTHPSFFTNIRICLVTPVSMVSAFYASLFKDLCPEQGDDRVGAAAVRSLL